MELNVGHLVIGSYFQLHSMITENGVESDARGVGIIVYWICLYYEAKRKLCVHSWASKFLNMSRCTKFAAKKRKLVTGI